MVPERRPYGMSGLVLNHMYRVGQNRIYTPYIW